MRVAQMIDRVHLSGGAERLQHTFAEALDPNEVALTVITLREGLPESEAELRDRGVRIASFPAERFADLQRARELVRFVRAERFDLLHAHLVRVDDPGAASRARSAAPRSSPRSTTPSAAPASARRCRSRSAGCCAAPPSA